VKPYRRHALVILFLVLLFSGDVGSIGAPAPTDVTYIYEKDDGPVPKPVQKGLDTLNRQNIVATAIDDDTTDGTGETPAQYKISLPAAKAAGLPTLVVMAGDKVVRTVKNPTTEADVVEAVQ
jgi:hypothetical protein